jgi:hypothetical protein
MIAVLPATSVDCERGFSSLSRIKTDLRNNLETPHLCHLIRISETDMDSLTFYTDHSESLVAAWRRHKRQRLSGKGDVAIM